MIRYQITDGTAHLDFESWLAGIDGDADYVQLRESGLTPRELGAAIARIRLRGGRCRLLVNDRIDVALAFGAAGVHLRGGAVAVTEVRRITPPGFAITVACHALKDVQGAAGADYALLSPIFRPLSKPDSRVPLGVEGLRKIAAEAPVPVIALGGITAGLLTACVEAGAAGVAGITGFRR